MKIATKTFEEYSNAVIPLMRYPQAGNNYVYPTLGLAGESGEFADKIKKIIRDKDGVVSQDDKQSLLKELGDVLWYITACAYELNSDLEEVARMNVDKLLDMNARGVLQGSGDDR